MLRTAILVLGLWCVTVSAAYAGISCGALNEECCPSAPGCDAGLECVPPSGETLNRGSTGATGGGATFGLGICIECGDPGEPCCDGMTCATDAACVAGTCEACGDEGQPCCGTDCDSSLLVCDQGTCVECGAAGEPCCSGMICSTDTMCVGGTCVCGDAGQPCCNGNMCNSENLLCSGSLCEACGAVGEQCCEGNVCSDAGVVCSEDICEPFPAAPMMGTGVIVALLAMLTGIGALALKPR